MDSYLPGNAEWKFVFDVFCMFEGPIYFVMSIFPVMIKEFGGGGGLVYGKKVCGGFKATFLIHLGV